MPLEGRELHVAISEKETCPIHRDWHDEETDFKEKSVRYTEIRHTISHMKSRMRESRTSGSVRGVPCERYVYSTLVLRGEQQATIHQIGVHPVPVPGKMNKNSLLYGKEMRPKNA